MWLTELQGHAVVAVLHGVFKVMAVPGNPGNIATMGADTAITSTGGGNFWIAHSDGSIRRLHYGDMPGDIYFAHDQNGVWAAGASVVTRFQGLQRVRTWHVPGKTSISVAARDGEAYVLSRDDRTGKYYVITITRTGALSVLAIPAVLNYDSEIAVDGLGGIWLSSDNPKAIVHLSKAGPR